MDDLSKACRLRGGRQAWTRRAAQAVAQCLALWVAASAGVGNADTPPDAKPSSGERLPAAVVAHHGAPSDPLASLRSVRLASTEKSVSRPAVDEGQPAASLIRFNVQGEERTSQTEERTSREQAGVSEVEERTTQEQENSVRDDGAAAPSGVAGDPLDPLGSLHFVAAEPSVFRTLQPPVGEGDQLGESSLTFRHDERASNARLAARSQPAETNLPEGVPPAPPPAVEEPLPPGPTTPNTPGAADDLATSEKVGKEPPPQRSNLQFLRRQTVLLEPGEWQFDAGLIYTLFESDLPVALVDGGGDVVGVTEGFLRQRLLYVPLEARYGVRDGFQVFASLPLGISNTEFTLWDLGQDEHTTVGGTGDLDLGGSWLVCEGKGCSPDVVFTLDVTVPLVEPSFPILTVLTPDSTLGEGFWALSADVLFIHRYDPLFIFYGLGYRHLFEEDVEGVDIQPGEQIGYRFGVGFAVNECVTLSTSFSGFYITETYLNNQRLPGSILEPGRLRFAATIAKGDRICEPFAEIGMTEDAPSMRVGAVWTF